jgi:1,4-alpha-glucan branching enzyme/maltooligosyltrehalose trehalohydrolase
MLECVHMTPRHLGRTPEGNVIHYNAQWNDETHHALHVLLTGESDGYYAPFADKPICHLGHHLTATLANVCAPSGAEHLPLSCFVNFLQNHDQIGNRAMGERLSMLAPKDALLAATALLLLAPSPPLLFMGEEWGTQRPFLYFCNLAENLRAAITAGRRKEFSAFERFSDPAALARIPDPCAEDTFRQATLDWQEAQQPEHQEWLALYRALLRLRQTAIVPHVRDIRKAGYDALSSHALTAYWTLGNGQRLAVHTNLGPDTAQLASPATGHLLYASTRDISPMMTKGELPGYTTAWFLEDNHD